MKIGSLSRLILCRGVSRTIPTYRLVGLAVGVVAVARAVVPVVVATLAVVVAGAAVAAAVVAVVAAVAAVAAVVPVVLAVAVAQRSRPGPFFLLCFLLAQQLFS